MVTPEPAGLDSDPSELNTKLVPTLTQPTWLPVAEDRSDRTDSGVLMPDAERGAVGFAHRNCTLTGVPAELKPVIAPPLIVSLVKVVKSLPITKPVPAVPPPFASPSWSCRSQAK